MSKKIEGRDKYPVFREYSRHKSKSYTNWGPASRVKSRFSPSSPTLLNSLRAKRTLLYVYLVLPKHINQKKTTLSCTFYDPNCIHLDAQHHRGECSATSTIKTTRTASRYLKGQKYYCNSLNFFIV